MTEEEIKERANKIQKARANFHRNLDELKDKYFNKIKNLAEERKQRKIEEERKKIKQIKQD